MIQLALALYLSPHSLRGREIRYSKPTILEIISAAPNVDTHKSAEKPIDLD